MSRSILKLNQLFLVLLVVSVLVACSTTSSDSPLSSLSIEPPTKVSTIALNLVRPTVTFTPLPPSATPIPSSTITPSMTPTVTNTPWAKPTSGPTPTYVPGWYQVQSGDTPYGIAIKYDMSLEQFVEINQLNENLRLDVADIVAVWKPVRKQLPQSYLIHDSEVVYSPAYREWDTQKFVEEQDGFLAEYSELIKLEQEKEAEEISGAEMIDMMATKYHIGPRVLLGTMEMISGWVSKKRPQTKYAFGLRDPGRAKLSQQMAWAAEELLHGYYVQLEGRGDWVVPRNGITTRLYPGTNAGSAAIIYLLARVIKPASDLPLILEEERFQKTYQRLFGEIDGGPVMPLDGKQPYFAMPFADGERWSFSGGPHGGYFDYYSAWAALDFAPPLKNRCRLAPNPVYAISSGLVVSSDKGETWIDIDEDGDIHTGWSLLYMHLGTEGRIQKGERVQTGDQLGYPSCEGGFSSASHVHIARMYNGQWMPADRPIPFQIGDWIAEARLNNSYKGFLLNTVTGYRLESCFCRIEEMNIFPGDQPIPPTLTP